MEILMRLINPAILLLACAAAGCKSYEDSFNRNLDSTGLYVTNSAANTVSMFAADPKGGALSDLGTVAAGTTPQYIAVNSAGTFAYVVNRDSNDVYVYSVNKNTRKLSFVSSVATGSSPRMIALHSGGKFAYVVNQGSDNMTGFSIDATTGALTSLGATPVTGSTAPLALAITGDDLFVADNSTTDVYRFTIDSTGLLTGHGTPSYDDTTCDTPTNVFAGSGTNPRVYIACTAPTETIKYFTVASWAPASTASINNGGAPTSLSMNTNNTLAIVANSGSATISVYSVSSGALTGAGQVSTCAGPSQTLVGSNFAYVICNTDNKVQAFSISGTTLTSIGTFSTGSSPTSIAGY